MPYKTDLVAGGPLRTRHFWISIVFAAALGTADLHAQLKMLRVDPPQTDPAIESVEGPHLAVYDPQVASNHRLFLSSPGPTISRSAAWTLTAPLLKRATMPSRLIMRTT